MFNKPQVCIVGGTGTLGNALIKALHTYNKITVFSRDELKQQLLKKRYPEITCILGDIRDPQSIERALKGMQVVFHVAALKHVDVLEANPLESYKTNVQGTINVANACVENGVNHCVFSSTDKAVLPINTYGYCKALSESYLLNLNGQGETKFSVFRWGNVLGSRGSVIHSFIKTLKEEHRIYLTDKRMTRFWIHIDQAVDFMVGNYRHAPKDKVMVPYMEAASVARVAATIAKLLGISEYETQIIGLRKGEKIHECLESNHDFCIRSDTANRISDEQLEKMLAPLIKEHL